MGAWMKIAQKRELVRHYAEHPWMTQPELAVWSMERFTLKRHPAQSMISDILKNAKAIMSESYGDGNRRKPLRVTSVRLEKRLWIQATEARSVCLSRAFIRMKARDLPVELCDGWDLSLSDGWLTKFEKRHGLRLRQLHDEAASADPKSVEAGRQRLQELVELYDPCDVYNMDETGLCYAMAPARSIGTKGKRGVKKSKIRITIALTANADGSDAFPPLY
ncbi:hypothetical protein PHYSODRAFT_470975 [Phytophthora sojae]|uniref:HTH CENPB-type domain-containing protein n=1 Tax=Phytophthora sojae (strain P6497) TaxID=1094619 RepID=G4YJH7_PHYSP|nr:hypothetical protein PHYSODRAFT_470975 [Phytophthora sojae]EGZ29932.1 hypothetical protein PHYSODRAFT_470975 [Phytophthora sojae]|eukprot:XP_009517207.1 hypothetical protein PHYSODRAFT_470975 [Phytophthora sojae]